MAKTKPKSLYPVKKKEVKITKVMLIQKEKQRKKNRTKNTPILKEKQRTRKTLDEFTV